MPVHAVGRKARRLLLLFTPQRFVKGRVRLGGTEPRVDSTRRGRSHPEGKQSAAFEGRRPQDHRGLLNMREVEVIAGLQSQTVPGCPYSREL